MPSSGILYHVALVRTDVSEQLSASIIRVTRTGELGTVSHNYPLIHAAKFLVPSLPSLVTLIMEALSSSEMSVLARATRHNTQKKAFFIDTTVKTSDVK
jgi:hypothetical protein